MKSIKIIPKIRLNGVVVVPGDKSVSHRAAILASLVKGRTKIKNFLFSDDCLVTLKVLRSLGVNVVCRKDSSEILINSKGRLKEAKEPLFMKESGTSARVLLGVLAGQKFISRMTAAPSLMKRPMLRVIKPLRLMGAQISARKTSTNEFLPLKVEPSSLKGIRWVQEVASAQVKSAILLAGLFAQGKTIVKEPVVTRDHTERMLKHFGASIKVRGGEVCIHPCEMKTPGEVRVPSDFSSAAFFIVAALLVKGSRILVKNVGINPTRFGAFHVLKRMGAKLNIVNRRMSFEPLADIEALYSPSLTATVINSEEIPSLIDELPILMVACARAQGETVIKGAEELRVKETDRIVSMFYNLKQLGVKVDIKRDHNRKKEVIVISGGSSFHGAALKSFGDHRTAMSAYVAALGAQGVSTLDNASCIKKSFPGFFDVMRQLFAA